MANEKEKIIKKLGSPATVTYLDGSTKDIKCLISKASHFNNSLEAVESHRKGDFMVGDNVTSGCYITNKVTGEQFITIAMYPSSYKDKFLSTVYRMLVVNSTLSVKRFEETADENGNITKEENDIISDLPSFIEVITQDLRQFKPGLQDDSEYLIFIPSQELNTLDNIYINVEGRELKLKLVSEDYITFKGISILEVKTETRR